MPTGLYQHPDCCGAMVRGPVLFVALLALLHCTAAAVALLNAASVSPVKLALRPPAWAPTPTQFRRFGAIWRPLRPRRFLAQSVFLQQQVIVAPSKPAVVVSAPQAKAEPPWPSARLILGDGTDIDGVSIGADRSMAGEVVFATGMTGYVETLTDPSYKGQILVFTYPLIGNYGVPDPSVRDPYGLAKFFESDAIHVAGVVLADYSHDYSHWNAASSLSEWLRSHNIPCIAGVDTRALTKTIRDQGSMLGKIIVEGRHIAFDDPNQRNLIAEVSRTEPTLYGSGSKTVIAVDFGIKNNIIRELLRGDVTVKVVPWDYDYTQEQYDGVFLSNGPGDPRMAGVAIEHLQKAMEGWAPIFGICMGHQVLSLAAGAATYKMKFGNRGLNQPVVDLRTGRTYITSQNHGFACDEDTLPADYVPRFRNLNDQSNEGIAHRTKPIFSAQFHPEGASGPQDTEFLFEEFLGLVEGLEVAEGKAVAVSEHRPIKKALLLGSGGLSIGQAGEFDYSGSQAIKALKEMEIQVILVNPNIATIQTSPGMADKTYFHPLTCDYIREIIAKERPDSILLQFGGQTALNIGVELYDAGVLEEFNVRVLGTSVESIRASEDRERFARKMAEIGEEVAPSMTTDCAEGALAIADRLGYPVLVRTAFALGGLGSGFADTPEQLISIVTQALSGSVNAQVIIDKSLKGWKEIEYEVVRDSADNCIAVCNMENFDPLGIHTGDSIVVAPSQTLTNSEYYRLRDAALRIARHMNIVGECNVQYALDPASERYYIIEMNARLSRSSALASKATGYPLAYVAAKLACGFTLPEVKNSVTKETSACFEPSLDYVVVKVPRWDLGKFQRASSEIGSSMKSVGEVMAIGRTFQEAFQKGLRMVGMDPISEPPAVLPPSNLEWQLSHPNHERVRHLFAALQQGYTVEQLFDLTQISAFFLHKLRNLVGIQRKLQATSLGNVALPLLKQAKQAGFSDKQIGACVGAEESLVRAYRQARHVTPFVKQIDTLAAEFLAKTNYLYMTYNAHAHDIAFDTHGVMVIGCGAYRIGSSCEFDWSAVSCLRALRSQGTPSILVNHNPETVSTDYDECDRLYFEELSQERVMDIYEAETSAGVIVSVGGQIPNNLAIPLHRAGIHVLGTHPDNIDCAEDRSRFSSLLDSIGVGQPAWKRLSNVPETLQFAEDVGYPVLVRPSYVLSGAAMNVAYTKRDLIQYLELAGNVSADNSIVVSKFIENANEIELDGVARDGSLLIHAISEHIENAGVHSGDATLLLPAQTITLETQRAIVEIAGKAAAALHITGPFNMQFLERDGHIQVIECNLRASRSFPFVSKTYGVNFVEIATRAITGFPVDPIRERTWKQEMAFVACKAAMFSFARLPGADPAPRVEMASTGEVACFGTDKYQAFLKALLATGFRLPQRNLLVSVSEQKLQDVIEPVRMMAAMGFSVFATPGTASALHGCGIECQSVSKSIVVDLIKCGAYDLVVNAQTNAADRNLDTDGYRIRRSAIDFKVPLVGDTKVFTMLAQSLRKTKTVDVLSWDDYMERLE